MAGAPRYIPPVDDSRPATVATFRRMKFAWRILLFSNFAVGTYLFFMPKKKSNHEPKSSIAEETPPVPFEGTTNFYESFMAFPPQLD